MAANKFENTIKKTSEARQIQPSADAWSKLSNALDKQDKKSSNTYIWFVGVAASIIGVLFLMHMFQPFQGIENSTEPAVVNATSGTEINTENAIETNNVQANSEVLVSTTKSNQKQVIANKASKITNKKTLMNSANTKETEYAFIDKDEKTNEIVSKEYEFQNNLVEANSSKIQTSETVVLKDNPETAIAEAALNAEVEALLKQAKQTVSSYKTSEENSHIAHANNLLEDVEMDLEKSFRDKVFETIKTNFTIVKTAVADRNN